MYKIVRPLVKALFIVIYRPKIIGRENILKDERIVLAGNHTNNFDCLLLLSSTKRPIHFLGKHTLFKGPKKIIFKCMGVIPVDRTKKRNSEALRKAIDVLNEEKVIGIFPEGTINRTDDIILPFKMGAVKMAYESNSKIVPFVITGKYRPFKNDLKIEFSKPLEMGSDLKKENNNIMKLISDMLRKEKVK